MSDEQLLRDVAQLARARASEALEPAWDRLAVGDLSADEVARLRTEAERSPEAAAAWQAFQPLDGAMRAALVARLGRELAAQAPPAPEAPRSRAAAPRSARAWLRWAWIPALVTACVLIAVRPWSSSDALPAYALRLGGASRSTRSAAPVAEAAAPVVFARGNQLELLLTPATSAGTAVEARLFSVRGAQVEALALPSPSRSEDGALRFTAVVGEDVQLPDGEFVLLVVVGRPGSLPAPEELARRTSTQASIRTERWSAWKLRARGAGQP